MFENTDLNDFWSEKEYAEKYLSAPVTDELVREIEEELGYKLPDSYVYLMKQHNGGCPKRAFVKGTYCAVEGIYGIGREKSCSLCGELGYSNWIGEWGYSEIGIPICDTGAAGHTMIFLDYRECGRNGEPKVVEIDQEWDYAISVLAENFEEFIGKLVYEEDNEILEAEDPYDLIEMQDVEEKDLMDVRRAVWGEWTWSLVIGWEAVLIAVLIWIKVSGTQNRGLKMLFGILMSALVIHTVITVCIAVGCFREVRRIDKYYEDTADQVWEEKDRKYFSLEKTPGKRYLNLNGYKPGDKVKVFIGKRSEPHFL